MKKIILIIGWMSVCFILKAQKIGLVLSSGGSPRIANIGIIKALEESNVPINYITGTSIGAIVGGKYAMGLTSIINAIQIQNPIKSICVPFRCVAHLGF